MLLLLLRGVTGPAIINMIIAELDLSTIYNDLVKKVRPPFNRIDLYYNFSCDPDFFSRRLRPPPVPKILLKKISKFVDCPKSDIYQDKLQSKFGNFWHGAYTTSNHTIFLVTCRSDSSLLSLRTSTT